MIKLTSKDSGATVEEDIRELCHWATPQIFCRSSNIMYIDTKTFGWNPYGYVKINGEFGLLTAHRNFGRADSQHWWYNRDPSRNGEFSYWHSTSETDSNKIFLYWDNLDNPPEVEYACREDTAIHCNGVENATFRLNVERVGFGIRGWRCANNHITLTGHTVGTGQRWEHSQDNHLWQTDLEYMGRRGICLSHDTTTNNLVHSFNFAHCGLNESIEGSLMFANGAHNNAALSMVGDHTTFGRFWPIDGSAVSFGERTHHNTVVRAVVSNSFNAAQDNSGHPGNRILQLVTINCTNSFDQSDFKAMGDTQDDRFGGYGLSDPPEKVLRSLVAINSGPFGCRTPDLSAVENLVVLGDTPEYRKRQEYPYYPDLPGYEDWTLDDAVNLQGPVPPVWHLGEKHG